MTVEKRHFPRIFTNPKTNTGEYSPKKATEHDGHKISRRAFLSALGLTGAGLVIDYRTNIDNSLLVRGLHWLEDIGLVKKPIPPTEFSNQEDYGKISTDNSLGVPIEEIREGTRIENGKAIYIGSLFGPEVAGNISYVKGLPYSGPDMATYKEYQRQGVKNAIAFTDIPLGTTIHAPFDGRVARPNTQSSDTSLGLNLVFQDNEGKWYSLLFSGARDVNMIAKAPKLDPNTMSSKLDSWLGVKIGDPLFIIQSKTLMPSPYLMGFNYPSQLRIESQYGPNGFGRDPWLPTDIFFLTQGDKILSPLTS